MKPFARTTALTVAMLLALSACKAEQKPVDVSAEKTEAGKTATDKTGIPGLATEKEQVSYTIGMAMGNQLSEIKDEVNLDTVVKALRAQMAGEKVLVTDEQAQKIMQEFGQKMQAAELDYLVNSVAASTTMAENYVGLPL